MSDIYESFGVTGAVMSEPSEGYNVEMASLPVAVRDGDDEITVSTEDSQGVEGVDTGLQDDGRIEVQINTDGEDAGVQIDGAQNEGTQDEAGFESVGDVPEELSAAANQVAQSEQAFNDMAQDAASRGLTPEAFSAIANEYGEKGTLSPDSYAELAKVGYSKAFIDSYIAGQEAHAANYTNAVIKYAGGEDKFNAVYTHLATTDANAAQALVDAMESRNLPLVKSIINLAAASQVKTFGKPAARTVTTQARPVTPVAKAAEGFADRSEMTKAMSDRRYGVDAAYTRSVEQKVINSPF